MASAISRRQQVRNERLLQDLIKNVPGNDTCADCGARNPGWASWSLGIFLCMRCAALHRKLGTHISKVKSLSMDSWSNEHIENMKRIGNLESNRIYNPRNVKASIPIDVDEVDSAMERYIRQKYEHRVFSAESRPGTRQNTGSTSSVEDRPPPLPPKPAKKFGFGLRAASSTFPTSRASSTLTPPVSPGLSFGAEVSKDPSPPRLSKASRVFGSNIERPGDSFEQKLVTLREMGFSDEKRNATVLKGLNGNLDGAVEALIRLGEGSRRPSRTHSPSSGQTNGLSFDNRAKSPASNHSSNPFDALDKPQPPLPPQQLAPVQTQFNQVGGYPQSAQSSYNPFMQNQSAQPPQQALDQTFQNLSLSQPQQQPQPLFPHRTGGQTQATQSNPFMQSFTAPPVPQMPAQYAGAAGSQPGYYQQPQQQQQQPQQQQSWTPQSAHPSGANGAGNPFLRTSRSQIFSQPTSSLDSSLYSSQGSFNANAAFSVQPQMQQQQMPQQQQQQHQQQPFSAPLSQKPFTPPQQQNPFYPSQPATPFSGAQVQTQQPSFGASPGNPFQQTAPTQSPFQTQYQQQQPQQPQQAPNSTQSPFQAQYQQHPPQQLQQPPQQQFSMPQQQQPNNTFAQPNNPKSSILALYNYPHLAPARPTDSAPATPADAQNLSPFAAPQRSVTMPNLNANAAANSHNPFASSAMNVPAGAPQPGMQLQNGVPHAAGPPPVSMNGATGLGGAFSRESVDFAGLMAGRHSPDAFKGLSARYGVS